MIEDDVCGTCSLAAAVLLKVVRKVLARTKKVQSRKICFLSMMDHPYLSIYFIYPILIEKIIIDTKRKFIRVVCR